MNFLVSAKGTNITTWRATEDFTVRYRQAILSCAASGRDGTAETVYSSCLEELDRLAEAHQNICKQLNHLLEEGASSLSASRLKELTTEYYDTLYRHFSLFQSAPAYYQKSMEFLTMISAAVMTRSLEQLGLFARHLPKMALVAIGPAGRCEYSPFCRLQLYLVHEEVSASQLQTITLFSHTLHDEFEAVGVAVDPVISPRNPEWRGSLHEWQQRCQDGLLTTSSDSLIALLRMTDNYQLAGAAEVAVEMREMVFLSLRSSRLTQANLVARMESLSNGLGIMGGFKLERSGAGRGLFSLLDHELLPLSSALSALALIKGSSAVNSCDRILDLLKRREVDVDLTEKMLDTWHNLHELRLRREQELHNAGHAEYSVYLNPDELTSEQRHALKTALSSVAVIQRHVGIIFSGIGE